MRKMVCCLIFLPPNSEGDDKGKEKVNEKGKKPANKGNEKKDESENRPKINDVLEVKENSEMLENLKLDLHVAVDLGISTSLFQRLIFRCE
jgi:hypothetical protein